ncbi:hypothetical protein F4780DRAFT_791609 [Xylariomycetidae sp. FL0641]|nr:hypothetical protein F4780DRAFT_791609 [Xylariomycetidae sp. FL0641]
MSVMARMTRDDGGGEVVVAGALGYRTGPTDYAYRPGAHGYLWHADNQQAASSTYFFPLGFDAGDHTVRGYTCPARVRIPLAASAASSSPPAPVPPFQLDCRVRNWRSVVRTDNLGPTRNAGPRLDGPLRVAVTFADADGGGTREYAWAPSNVISWSPRKIALDVGVGRAVARIELSSNASNGCYGTMVEPRKEEQGDADSRGGGGGGGRSRYGAVVLGEFTEQPKAQLYVYQ